MSGDVDLTAASAQLPKKPKRLPLGRSNRRLSFERRIAIWLTILTFPAVALAFATAYIESNSFAVAVTVALATAIAFGLAFSFLLEQIIRPLQTLSNVVASLREEDFTFRARGGRRGDALGDLALEINALAASMQQQRSAASDAITLVERVLTTMQSPVFVFDDQRYLRLLNASAESTFSLARLHSIGCSATQLHLTPLFKIANGAIYEPRIGAIDAPRWTVSRSPFRLNGLPHTLLVLSDVAAVLRDEERTAWQRLIRVLSHEINNSLTPIHSIAGSLRLRVAHQTIPANDPTDLLRGLTIIEDRSASLNRFLQAYQRLLRLPQPVLRPVRLNDLVEQVAQLETRLAVRITRGPDIHLACDLDQVQQALINLIQNATDAVLSPEAYRDGQPPCVDLSWTASPSSIRLCIEDNGVGIANFDNLFVPFYTTKAAGSGIGLVLAQQIVHAHNGSISVFSGNGRQGTRVEMRFPIL